VAVVGAYAEPSVWNRALCSTNWNLLAHTCSRRKSIKAVSSLLPGTEKVLRILSGQ